MLGSYLTGVIGIAVLLAAWLAVQRAWARAFPDASGDPDPLAGRLGCRGCGCGEVCRRRQPEQTGPNQEGRA